MIQRSGIREVFKDIKQAGDWDATGPLLYGFFFLDGDLIKLKSVGAKLESDDYKIVDIFCAEKDENINTKQYFLHVEKVEIHTVDTLFQRNMEFYAVAEEFDLDSYDGFDIGEIK